MDPKKSTIKTRLIRAIGLDTVERPRQLQQAAKTNEHHVVHALYTLEKQGLVEYRVRRNVHSSGRNLTDIHLTPKGVEVWRTMK